MNNLERAIDRMKRVCDACDELENMAVKDLDELRKRRQEAKETMRSLEYINESQKLSGREDIQRRAAIIAEEKRMISCMGVGIEV